jgi:hypothetical protein
MAFDVTAFVLTAMMTIDTAFDDLVASLRAHASFDSFSAALLFEALFVMLLEVFDHAVSTVHALLDVIKASSLTSFL